MRLVVKMARSNPKSHHLPCAVAYSREAVAGTGLHRAGRCWFVYSLAWVGQWTWAELCSLRATDLHRFAVQAADVYQAPQQNALPAAFQHCGAQQPAGEPAELKYELRRKVLLVQKLSEMSETVQLPQPARGWNGLKENICSCGGVCGFLFFFLSWTLHDTDIILIQVYLTGREPGIFYIAAPVQAKRMGELCCLLQLHQYSRSMAGFAYINLLWFIAISYAGLSSCKNFPAIPSLMVILWHT